MRTYVGVRGAEALLKQYGIVGTRGRGPWVQGNNLDYVFFSPNLKPLTHEGLEEVTAKATEASQNSIRWVYTVPGARPRQTAPAVAVKAMRKVLERYPPKDKEAIRIPWQLNTATAFHFASYEDRRIVLAPSVRGEVSPKLTNSLGAANVLRKHVHNYVFVKMESEIPSELRQAMKRAGADGLVIVERPDERPRGKSSWQFTSVLAVSPGPHTPKTVLQLLDKHARLPGWDAKVSLAK